MALTTTKRLKTAKQAVRKLVVQLGDSSKEDVADYLELNSAHISHLFNHDYLTPALERELIRARVLEPRPEPIPVEPCLECGEVHIRAHCPHKRAQRKRRPRFSVAADDPAMALQQLEKYYPGMFSLNALEEKENKK